MNEYIKDLLSNENILQDTIKISSELGYQEMPAEIEIQECYQ